MVQGRVSTHRDWQPVTRTAVSDTAIILRAREALARGPMASTELLGCVLALPGAPTRVAERIADSLFSRHEEFRRGESGEWRLVVPSTRVEEEVQAPRLLDLSYAVTDVETTGGGSKRGDRITEVAVVPVEKGRVGEAWVSLVNPERPIPSQIVALTGITAEMVRRAPRFPDVSTDLMAQLRGRLFVAHNATFDWGFLSAELLRSDDRRLAGDRLCTVRLARVLLPQLRRRSLDSLCSYFGVTIRERHRAAGDALGTAEVLCRLLEIAADQGLETWPHLSARLDRRTGRARRKRRALPAPVDYDSTA